MLKMLLPRTGFELTVFVTVAVFAGLAIGFILLELGV